MEFVQIRKEKIIIYADSNEREEEIRKFILSLLEVIKQIQEKLK